MGLPLLSCSITRVGLSSSSSSSSWCSSGSGGFRSSNCSSKLFDSPASSRSDLNKRNGKRNSRLNGLSLEKLKSVKASSSSAGQSSGEVIDDGDTAARGLAVTSGDVTSVGNFSSGEFVSAGSGGLAGPSGEVTSVGEFVGGSGGDFKAWDKIDAIVRLSYGIGIYCGMAVAGRFICEVAGIDYTGGFNASLDTIIAGLGYASPPIMALLFILDDEVVKLSPHARAIRDVEDEELRGFFHGMSAWQFILVVAASSVGEELFYRAAFQGALADIFLRGTDLISDSRGMVALTGLLPPFVPFAQVFAATITAALTGSLYYVAASPKDPTYIMAPVLKTRSARDELKKLFAAWYERRQMKKIYSPLLEGLLGLYLGFEWIQTNNLLAPIITHGIYSAVVLGNGLWKLHHHQQRLRLRVQKLETEGDDNSR
ncbi:CAAX prenyl protease 2 [Arabidopsis thaliana x Arabidopsis arenosa]|uniref:CAAX prenyl protease 2 n=1 Tax=Arabidopsis thaliana x Arabidopsis arenosa TaxID=1240361 RepID=A0A8T1Y5H0_9BRAS|nr:CAAX prenyl protease 2 [Arabidopsis thaliana x Arabidopsis arenosa]